jgi:hypothetical protein
MRNIEVKKAKIRKLVETYIRSSLFTPESSEEDYYDVDTLSFDIIAGNNKFIMDEVGYQTGYYVQVPAWAMEAIKAGVLMGQARLKRDLDAMKRAL